MIIITEVSIGFILPEEYNLMQKFKKEHNLDEWKASESTGMIAYSQKRYFSTEVKNGEEENDNDSIMGDCGDRSDQSDTERNTAKGV